MRAELFTVATPPTLGLGRLQRSLAKFGHSLTILGLDADEYRGMGWKFKTFLRGMRGSLAETVLFCDGYDTLCLEPLERILSKFSALAHPIIFSYEPQSRPELCLSLNSGLLIANRLALLAVFDEATLDEAFPDHFNDEAELQTIYSRNPDIFSIDADGVIFYTVGALSAELEVQGNRLVNPRTGLAPSFVHGPHGWDLTSLEARISELN